MTDGGTLHKEHIRVHSAKRFRERYGQELTPKMRAAFHRQIDSGHNAWLVAMQRGVGDGTEVYFVLDKSVSAEPIVVIFRRDWMEIVTFMTPVFYRRQINGELARERQARLRHAQDLAGAPDLRRREA